MSFIKRLFGFGKKKSKITLEEAERVIKIGEQHVRIINESLKIANESKSPSTTHSRLDIARQNLKALKALAKDHSFITLTQLNQVEKNILEIEQEANAASNLFTATNINIKDLDPERTFTDQATDLARKNQDISDGVFFSATLNITTPLKYLQLDNKVKTPEEADLISSPMKYGCWLPHIPIEHRIIKNSERASQFGPVPSNGGEVLPNLIKYRTIMERPLDPQNKGAFLELEARAVEIVREVPAIFVDTTYCFGVMFREMIVDLKYLSDAHLIELTHNGYTSTLDLKTLSEKDLKTLKGIGPKKAEEIIEQLSKI